ncbi:ORF132 [White spot syndrome virus]|uniref:Wsv269 n=3 Tax=White spot syndrome virus TaxID=342409 RepID=Q77J38_WSSVS|nr:wsv269 [Shrimp white spot syndrome virus]YP_009220566.1 hypothetical protein SWSSV_gp092 [White spot syndrome virus]AYW76586.1 hypothetical protein [Procambarus clarkii virus]AAK77801.1 ORF132 [White spot syndrome virus]AAL33272.1 wsv269 [Shrimp white spot syndrome virus]AAL89192.1 WSSV324 [Shrimp white spot syndrome virus]AFX59643.1 wsv269 [White spot syndrome virus]
MESVRDVKFYTFMNVLAEKAKKIQRLNKDKGWRTSINAEIGYGGARLMDVRFTGRKSMDELARCLYNCDGEYTTLRLVGSSAGNIIVYSLAFIMGIRGECCGFNVNNRLRMGKIIDRELFYKITGLNFPETVKCTCDGVRAICDLFLEVAALQEHPAWHETKEVGKKQQQHFNEFGSQYPGTKFNKRHKLSTKIIQQMFSEEKTMEQVLAFSEGTAASGFSDLYVEAPIQYVVNMYRAISNMEGRVGAMYNLSRVLILLCSRWEKKPGYKNDFYSKCEMYIGSKKIVDDESFIFTDLITGDLVPLVRLAPSNEDIQRDVIRFNDSTDILMDSIDVRDVVLPVLSKIIWQNVSARLKLRNNKSLSKLAKWKWNGMVSTHDNFDSNDYVIEHKRQLAADIMSDSLSKNHLPNFSKTITEYDEKENKTTPLICWNYIFELSPMGKHLFPLEEVCGFYEASLPLITPWQLKVVQKKRGRQMVIYGPRKRPRTQ